MTMLHSLSHENLHRILMGIPYNLSTVKGLHKEGCLRAGYYISLAHVLIVSILSLCMASYDGGDGGGNWWNGILGVDPHAVYEHLQSQDPLSSVSSWSYNATAFFQVRDTNIHLLWESSKSFAKSALKIKEAIKSRLSKKRKISTSSSSPNEPFKLDDLRIAVESFSFVSNRRNLREMLKSGNGNFDGINSHLVIQLKTLCSCYYLLENSNIRHKSSRMIGTRTKKAEAKKELFLNILRHCHRAKYFKLASNYKCQRDESNVT
jgi:hypothetical protein